MENIEYLDFLSDTFTIEELNEAERPSQIVTTDEEPAPKMFKTATVTDVEKTKDTKYRNHNRSTKCAVGLLRGTYIRGFPLHIVVQLFVVKLL